MTKIFIINAAQTFAHSGGKLNVFLAEKTAEFFQKQPNFEVKITSIEQGYDLAAEVEKYLWADLIIYHTPVWWFQLPFGFKAYIDKVFSEGYGKIYKSDGRTSADPKRNYGKGGLLQGRKYMLVSTWNAPEEAFTLEGEFFNQKSVDEGTFFGFHRMNAFIGLEQKQSFHFHDVMKNPDLENTLPVYFKHLENQFL